MNAKLGFLLDPFACIAVTHVEQNRPRAEKVIVPTAIRSRGSWQFYEASAWPAQRRKVLTHIVGKEKLGEEVGLESVLRDVSRKDRVSYFAALFSAARAACGGALRDVNWTEIVICVPSYVTALVSPALVFDPTGRVVDGVMQIHPESRELYRDLRLAATHARFDKASVSPSFMHAARASFGPQGRTADAAGKLGCVVEVGPAGIGLMPYGISEDAQRVVKDSKASPHFIACDLKAFIQERLGQSAAGSTGIDHLAGVTDELYAQLPARLQEGSWPPVEMDGTHGEMFRLRSGSSVFGADWSPLNAKIRSLVGGKGLIPNELAERLRVDRKSNKYFVRYTLCGSLASMAGMSDVLDTLLCGDVRRARAENARINSPLLGIIDHNQAPPNLRKLISEAPSHVSVLLQALKQQAEEEPESDTSNERGIYQSVEFGGDKQSVKRSLKDDVTQPRILLYQVVAPSDSEATNEQEYTFTIPVTLESGRGVYVGVKREFRVSFSLMPWNRGQRVQLEMEVLPSYRMLLTATVAGMPHPVTITPMPIDRVAAIQDAGLRDDLKVNEERVLVRPVSLGRAELTISPVHQRLTDALESGELSASYSALSAAV